MMTTQLPEKIILPDCPAPRHNSVYAARGYNKAGTPRGEVLKPKCICPYSLAMIERQIERQQEWQRRRRMQQAAVPAWWTGPYRILDECPADRHWTMRAGMGDRSAGKGRYTHGHARCICPQALIAVANSMPKRHYAKTRERTRANARARREAERAIERERIEAAHFVTKEIDWSKRICADSIEIFDAAGFGRATQREIDRARTVCRSCPILDACLAYAVQHHEDGIWGGTTTQQRRGIARKQAMQDA